MRLLFTLLGAGGGGQCATTSLEPSPSLRPSSNEDCPCSEALGSPWEQPGTVAQGPWSLHAAPGRRSQRGARSGEGFFQGTPWVPEVQSQEEELLLGSCLDAPVNSFILWEHKVFILCLIVGAQLILFLSLEESNR